MTLGSDSDRLLSSGEAIHFGSNHVTIFVLVCLIVCHRIFIDVVKLCHTYQWKRRQRQSHVIDSRSRDIGITCILGMSEEADGSNPVEKFRLLAYLAYLRSRVDTKQRRLTVNATSEYHEARNDNARKKPISHLHKS